MATLRSLVPKVEIGRDSDEVVFISSPKGEKYGIVFSYDHYYSDTFFAGFNLKHGDLKLKNARSGTEDENSRLRGQVLSVCKDMLDCWDENEAPFHLYRDVERDQLTEDDYEKIYHLLKNE